MLRQQGLVEADLVNQPLVLGQLAYQGGDHADILGTRGPDHRRC
jgi:hypothetical protein